MRIFQTVAGKGGASCDEIIDKLRGEYGAERQFRKSAVLNHLLSLRAVGLLRIAPDQAAKENEYSLRFEVTGQGAAKRDKYFRQTG